MTKKAETTSRTRELTPPAAWTPPKVRVIGPMRSRINVLVHDMAQVEETRLRAAFIGQLESAANEGANAAQMHHMIDVWEAARPMQ